MTNDIKDIKIPGVTDKKKFLHWLLDIKREIRSTQCHPWDVDKALRVAIRYETIESLINRL